MRPSRLVAYFATVQGRAVATCCRNPRATARASRSSTPTHVRMPAARSVAPPPAATGFGSGTA